MVREWRTRRSRSQFDLALDVGVSAKHLSFVETGKSRPSPELVLAIARHLDVPLREQNTLLLAAGFAPRFSRTPLEDSTMATIRGSLQRLLDAHDPYPGVVLDAQWNVVLANAPASRLTATLPAELATPMNMFRASLHPDGFAAITANFDEWGAYLLSQLHRLAAISADPALLDLEREVAEYPNVRDLQGRLAWNDPPPVPSLLIPCQLRLGAIELSMFTTLTTFGSARDITLDELVVELFYPTNDATDEALRNLSDAASFEIARPPEGSVRRR
jgi:transcriptional regulator with XRE-family HTH domain